MFHVSKEERESNLMCRSRTGAISFVIASSTSLHVFQRLPSCTGPADCIENGNVSDGKCETKT